MLLSHKTSLRLRWLKADTIQLFSPCCNPATLTNAYFLFMSRCGCNYIAWRSTLQISNPSFINSVLSVHGTVSPLAPHLLKLLLLKGVSCLFSTNFSEGWKGGSKKSDISLTNPGLLLGFGEGKAVWWSSLHLPRSILCGLDGGGWKPIFLLEFGQQEGQSRCCCGMLRLHLHSLTKPLAANCKASSLSAVLKINNKMLCFVRANKPHSALMKHHE